MLLDAGFANIEVLSCIHPKVAHAMNKEAIKRISSELGRAEGKNIITLVPNRAGYRNFLDLGLSPHGLNHTMGIFFSAVEAHNLANLGRPLMETIDEYKSFVSDAISRNIRVAGYISAALGYLEPRSNIIIRTDVSRINDYIDLLLDLGVETVTLSDLQGIAGKEETRTFFETLLNIRKNRGVDKLGYHPHHVSGEKGIANSRVAYDLGIRRFDSSLGGTGGCVTGAPGNQPTEGLIRFFPCIRGQNRNKRGEIIIPDGTGGEGTIQQDTPPGFNLNRAIRQWVTSTGLPPKQGLLSGRRGAARPRWYRNRIWLQP